ncbi:type III-B CRISPR module RAMP protein Cmr4 [Desulfotomaculum copahuensis]|uniref:Type III-B CRISPR module RAMP protein Cmr4 n=1 Tax=Desulfotomaculum copahuensis TaxID=1838280 RepID=A0A1B7LCM5_9FIRM|nr:type III-B CRISPR module RAMP protein Cmr4 [Desulfotomaculum copahuensis]OAT80420.1 type III-B CRISPR module RAMP protein Cmr4 [Desulfotomaculum copahuensis]
MKSVIMGLLAETALHPGTEQSAGVIDLPVAREAVNGYPVLVGSSLKGALRDLAEQNWGEKNSRVESIFGKQDNAGAVAVTDARLLLLPARSLTGHYKWVTCPYLLERYQRDRELVGMPYDFNIPEVKKEQAMIHADGKSDQQDAFFLEELVFNVKRQDLSSLINSVSGLISHQSVQNRLAGQLAVISDDDFAYFAQYGLQVNARNVLDNKSKTSKNLWYEETIPPDSLFYALLIPRPGADDVLTELQKLFTARPYLQVGGNETVGQGWCAVTWLAGKDGGR